MKYIITIINNNIHVSQIKRCMKIISENNTNKMQILLHSFADVIEYVNNILADMWSNLHTSLPIHIEIKEAEKNEEKRFKEIINCVIFSTVEIKIQNTGSKNFKISRKTLANKEDTAIVGVSSFFDVNNFKSVINLINFDLSSIWNGKIPLPYQLIIIKTDEGDDEKCQN